MQLASQHERVVTVIPGEYFSILMQLTLNTSHTDENGKTAIPTIKSATANEAIKILVTATCSLEEHMTAAITKQLPTITITSINNKMVNLAKAVASIHTTFLSKAAHAVSFNVFRITPA